MAHIESASVVGLMWTVSWQAAIFAAVVWVIARLAKNAPARLRHALWLLVLVKLFVPPFAYLPPELAFWQEARQSPPTPAAAVSPIRAPAAPNLVRAAGPTGAVAPRASSPPFLERTSICDILLVAWLAGVFSMLAVLFLRRSRQSALLRDSVAADERLTRLLAQAAARLAVRRIPELRVIRNAGPPMLVGVLRPAILLPPRAASTCRESDVEAILLHELAHVERRDIAVLWLQQIVKALFFFHPAVWLAGLELKRECELACDELVLSASGISPRDYAAGYVSALKVANHVTAAVPSTLSMAEPFEAEKRRVERILERPVSRMSEWWMIGLAAVVAVGLPTFAGVAARQAVRASESVKGHVPAPAAGIADMKASVTARTAPAKGPGPSATAADQVNLPVFQNLATELLTERQPSTTIVVGPRIARGDSDAKGSKVAGGPSVMEARDSVASRAVIVTVPTAWSVDGFWTDTGIDLSQGQKIHVTASGRWSPGIRLWGGPDGVVFEWPDQWLNPYITSAEGPQVKDHFGALIGYVGPAPLVPSLYGNCSLEYRFECISRMVLLGSDATVASPAAGRLYLGMNADAYAGNLDPHVVGGNITATVVVDRSREEQLR